LSKKSRSKCHSNRFMVAVCDVHAYTVTVS
jgi:hypothetical protein